MKIFSKISPDIRTDVFRISCRDYLRETLKKAYAMMFPKVAPEILPRGSARIFWKLLWEVLPIFFSGDARGSSQVIIIFLSKVTTEILSAAAPRENH